MKTLYYTIKDFKFSIYLAGKPSKSSLIDTVLLLRSYLIAASLMRILIFLAVRN